MACEETLTRREGVNPKMQMSFSHQPTKQSTYRVAGLARENGSRLGLVHVEVLEIGLIYLPGQGLLVS